MKTVQHATWIKNHMEMHALDGKTPYEMLYKSKPHLEDLPEWGSHVSILHEGQGKLEDHADQAHWVGYSGNTQGHRVYWLGRRQVTVKLNITFDHSMVIIQHQDMTEEGANPPGNSHIPDDNQQNVVHKPSPHTQDQAHNSVLHGFESQDALQPNSHKGCGHRICKPSVYVHDIRKG